MGNIFKGDPNYDSLSPQTTKGDLAVYGAAGSTRFPAGADGLFVKADSTQPLGLAYASPAGVVLGVTRSAADISLTTATDVLVATNAGTNMTVTLPDLASNIGKVIQVWKYGGYDGANGQTGVTRVVGASTNAVFTNAGSATFNGVTMTTQAESYRFLASNATLWITLQHQTNYTSSYTPTLSAVGTATNVNFFWNRTGRWLHVNGTFTTGTVGGSLFSCSLPNPGIWSIDTTYLNDNGHTTTQTGGIVGHINGQGTGSDYGQVLTCSGTTTSLVFIGGGISGSSPLVPVNANSYLNNTVAVGIDFKVPILGWDE